MRLDQYLVLKGYFDSRNKAANSVKLGHFTVNEKTVVKPSFAVNDDDVVKRQVVEKTYVARSAHKLMKAIQAFQLECADKVFADLGASTGGFCQVLLEEGAKRIYAVDIVNCTVTVSNIADGIESIESENVAAPAVYYNLQGVEVENPAEGNVYIKVVNGKATKVVK